MRFNDGALDPAGRLWAGTMQRGIAEPAGAIFCIEPDFSHRRVFGHFWTPNGLAFDPARRRMYFSDSHPSVQTIWVCDYDVATGTPSSRRIFATTHAVAGRPDGAFIDNDGVYWIAGVGGAELLRFAPSGEPLDPLPVPVTHPTKIVMDRNSPPAAYVTTRRTADGSVMPGSSRTSSNEPCTSAATGERDALARSSDFGVNTTSGLRTSRRT